MLLRKKWLRRLFAQIPNVGEQGRQCGRINNICDGEELEYANEQYTHRERER